MAFLAVLVGRGQSRPPVRVDYAIFHVLQSLRTALADRVMVGITELGDWVVTTAVTLVTLILAHLATKLVAQRFNSSLFSIPSAFSFLMYLC